MLACSQRSHLPLCELTVRRPAWQDTEGGLQRTVSKKERPPVQQPLRNWILPATTWVGFKADAAPVQPSDETAARLSVRRHPHYRLWTRGTLLGHTWIPDQRDCKKIHTYCFKPLRLGVICYSMIANWYTKKNKGPGLGTCLRGLRSLGLERAEGRRAGHRAQGSSRRKRQLWRPCRQMVKTECGLWIRLPGVSILASFNSSCPLFNHPKLQQPHR